MHRVGSWWRQTAVDPRPHFPANPHLTYRCGPVIISQWSGSLPGQAFKKWGCLPHARPRLSCHGRIMDTRKKKPESPSHCPCTETPWTVRKYPFGGLFGPAASITPTNEPVFADDNNSAYLTEGCGNHLAQCQARGDTTCSPHYQMYTRDRIISHMSWDTETPSTLLRYKYAAVSQYLLIN